MLIPPYFFFLGFFWFVFFLFCFFVFDRIWLCSQGWPGTRFYCLAIPSAGMTCMHSTPALQPHSLFLQEWPKLHQSFFLKKCSKGRNVCGICTPFWMWWLMWDAVAPGVNQKAIFLTWLMNLVLNLRPHTLAQGFFESVSKTSLELAPSKCI